MAIHDFHRKLADSEDPVLQAKLREIYRAFFPSVAVLDIEHMNQDRDFQFSGRDVRVRLRGPREGCVVHWIEEWIEEKIREPGRSSSFPDVLVEYLSNEQRGTVGWIYTSRAHWLSYVRQPPGRLNVLLIPMQPLQTWFQANWHRLGQDWPGESWGPGGSRYRSLNKAIPLEDAAFKTFLDAQGVKSYDVPFQWRRGA